MATFALPSHYPASVDVDGQPLHVRIKRLTFTEVLDFEKRWQAVQREAQRAEVVAEQLARKASVDGAIPTSDAQVLAQLDLDDPAAAQRLDGLREAARASNLAFATDVLQRYVTIDGGQVEGYPDAVSGERIFDWWPGRADVAEALFSLIYAHNLAKSSTEKKALLSRFGSGASSAASTPTAAGDAPVTTVSAAPRPALASVATVPASDGSSPSGSTDASPSRPVPSAG
jgi:hypothetical protein